MRKLNSIHQRLSSAVRGLLTIGSSSAPAARAFVGEALESRILFNTYTVTTTNDSGAGSLRQAITSANSHVGADVIKFAIGSGAKTITPLSRLPGITDIVTIDGT